MNYETFINNLFWLPFCNDSFGTFLKNKKFQLLKIFQFFEKTVARVVNFGQLWHEFR